MMIIGCDFHPSFQQIGGWRTLRSYNLNQHPTEDAPSFERILLEGWDSVDLNSEIE